MICRAPRQITRNLVVKNSRRCVHATDGTSPAKSLAHRTERNERASSNEAIGDRSGSPERSWPRRTWLRLGVSRLETSSGSVNLERDLPTPPAGETLETRRAHELERARGKGHERSGREIGCTA